MVFPIGPLVVSKHSRGAAPLGRKFAPMCLATCPFIVYLLYSHVTIHRLLTLLPRGLLILLLRGWLRAHAWTYYTTPASLATCSCLDLYSTPTGFATCSCMDSLLYCNPTCLATCKNFLVSFHVFYHRPMQGLVTLLRALPRALTWTPNSSPIHAWPLAHARTPYSTPMCLATCGCKNSLL